jgi:hypothetical protein
MFDIESLQRQYPRTGKNAGVTGLIPMSTFEANEKEIRKTLRSHKMRVFYRGPRYDKVSSVTYREDATHVIIYYRS